MENGVEFLLHLGLETVELNGEGFDIDVKAGEEVQANDRLGTFDLSFIEEKGKEIISVLIMPNFEEKMLEMNNLKTEEVEAGTGIVTLRSK